jgi:hypothetical protein
MPPETEEQIQIDPVADTEANAARVLAEQAETAARIAEARAALDAANAAALAASVIEDG